MISCKKRKRVGYRIGGELHIQLTGLTWRKKRSAQESFDPEAFMVRRSMPFRDRNEHGLYFVAYGESLDRFERVLRRMAGLEDGIVDALLTFSRAVNSERMGMGKVESNVASQTPVSRATCGL